MNRFREIMDHERSMQETVEELKHEIFNRIAMTTALPGTSVEQSTMKMGTVQFRSLGPNLDLSPETYFPKAQAEEVLRKISSCNTVTDIMRRLREMVSTRRIKWDGCSVTLNQNTLQVLREYIEEADRV